MAATEPYYCPEGDGGNRQVVNQDECAILDKTISGVPTQTTPLGREDDSHVDPAFRSADVAGS